MKKNILIASVAGSIAALGLAPFAIAQLTEGTNVGVDQAAITDALTQAGYEVLEIEVERDEVEAYVMLDGVQYEIEIDHTTGAILEIELEDDNEDKHEDDADADDDLDNDDAKSVEPDTADMTATETTAQ